MRSASLTYFRFTAGALPDSYFVTLPDTNRGRFHLQVDNKGEVKFVVKAQPESWESFKFTEVP